MTGQMMRAEIAEQPRLVAEMSHRTDITALGVRLAARLGERGTARIQLLGRGTSGNAAVYAKYLIERQLHVPATLIAPSVFTRAGVEPWGRSDFVIAISQSGASPDLVACLESARRAGALTLAVTNTVDGPLAAAAEAVVPIRAGEERAVAATKSYTLSLLALAQLVHGLGGDSLPAPDVLEHAVATQLDSPVPAEAAVLIGAARAVLVLGRGYANATAREAALKIMETTAVPALAFSSAEFRHGPVAALAPDTPVLLTGRDDELADECRRRGAPVLQMPVADLPPAIGPVADIVPFQLTALHASLRAGLDPDRPPALAKATRTL